MYYLDLYCYHCYLVTNTNQNYVLMQKVYKIGKHIYHNNSSKRSAKLIVKFAKPPPPLSLCFVQQITQLLRFNATLHNSTTYLNENNNIYILYLYELGFLLFNPTIKPNNEHATTQNTIPTAVKRYEFFCSKQNGKMKDERKCQ